MNAAAT